MKIIALLIDDPKTITIEQAEKQVDQLQGGYLTHVISSWDATLAKPSLLEMVQSFGGTKTFNWHGRFQWSLGS